LFTLPSISYQQLIESFFIHFTFNISSQHRLLFLNFNRILFNKTIKNTFFLIKMLIKILALFIFKTLLKPNKI
jgi:hypothetical protein